MIRHAHNEHLHCFLFQTPRILEATERRQDPASPIQEITKMGYLQCKTDISDGKVNYTIYNQCLIIF